MTRALIVGGPAAGRMEHAIGPNHGQRWRIALPSQMPVTPLGEAVPEQATINYAEYTFRQFTCDGQPIFLLAPPEWSDLEVLGELMNVYQRACYSDTHR